jgi:AraC family transcriptional regulator
MTVEIVQFPETRVAAVEHRGSPALEHETARKLVAWKLERGLRDQARYRSYGLHHNDPHQVAPADYRMEFCLSLDGEPIGDNPYGVYEKIIPGFRCAKARDVGSRMDNQAAKYLFETWLPSSGETWTGHPAIFHYVNVGPTVKPHEAITDVYLPLK